MTYPTNYPSDPNEPTAYPVPPVNAPRRSGGKLRRAAYWAAIPAALLIGLGIGLAGNGGTTPSAAGTIALPGPTVTVTQTAPAAAVVVKPATPVKPTAPPKPAKTVIPDGYSAVVGVDAPAGKYDAHSTDDTCYWEIDKHGTSDIIDNNLGAQGHLVVTLKRGEDFSSARCGDWTQE